MICDVVSFSFSLKNITKKTVSTCVIRKTNAFNKRVRLVQEKTPRPMLIKHANTESLSLDVANQATKGVNDVFNGVLLPTKTGFDHKKKRSIAVNETKTIKNAISLCKRGINSN